MLIEIFADFSCPWCFIGRRRLSRALAQRPRLSAEIIWQPFQLNPEAPQGGIDRRRQDRIFHDLDRSHAMELALAESGLKEGISFAFDRITRIPNTLSAHRLMRLAARSRCDAALAEAIYLAYFKNGEDIGDLAILLRCAAEAGLPPDEVLTFMRSDAEINTIETFESLARQGGVNGVPYFVLDRQYAIAGAQEPAVFLPLFDAIQVAADESLATLV